MVVPGKIVKWTDSGYMVFVPAKVSDRFTDDVLVEFDDGISITVQQRRYIYVLLRYISLWSSLSLDTEQIKETLKSDFMYEHLGTLHKTFSLADCPKEVASAFIEYILSFCLSWHVPIRQDDILQISQEVPNYIRICVLERACAVCGRHADIHHIDAVGMGGNRDKMIHIEKRVLPLCRKHHSEAHSIGRECFLEKYHLKPVKVDKEIARRLKLGKYKVSELDT